MKKDCFVIMPFSQKPEHPTHTEAHWTKLYETLISPAVKDLSYNCTRSENGPFDINHNIIDSLLKADIVIAVLTDKNPNVYYELGVRHALRKKTILLIEKEQSLPFDLGGCGKILYEYEKDEEWNHIDFRKQLEKFINSLNKNGCNDSPVAQYLKDEHDSGLKRVLSNGLKGVTLPEEIKHSNHPCNILLLGIRESHFHTDIIKYIIKKNDRKTRILLCHDKEVSLTRAKSLPRYADNPDRYHKKSLVDYEDYIKTFGEIKSNTIRFYNVMPFGLYLQCWNYSWFMPLWNYGAPSAVHNLVIETNTRSNLGRMLLANFYFLWRNASNTPPTDL